MDEQIPGPGAVETPGAVPDGAGGDPVLHGVDPVEHAQELLAEHVPLTLLVDLLTPTGETSDELLSEEGLPEEEWWADPADPEQPGA